MESVSHVVEQAFYEGVRRLAESTAYDPVKGSLFGNEDFGMASLIVVTVLIVALGSLAAGAGIGGGGLFVPIFAFVLGVGAKAAVPLSKATILGGALGNMMSIAFLRHPDKNKNKPLIDYEASTFMQSGELLGVVFGVLLNLVLPEILIIVFLAVLLSFNAYKTLQKGMSKYKAESKKLAKAATEEKTATEKVVMEEGIREGEIEHADRPSEKSDQEKMSEASTASTQDKKSSVHSDRSRANTEDSVSTTCPSIRSILGTWQDVFLRSVGVNVPNKTVSPARTPPISENPIKFQHEPKADVQVPPLQLQGIDFPAQDEEVQDADVAQTEDPDKAAALQEILDEDAPQFPLWAWAMLGPMTLFTIIYALIKKSVVSTCAPVAYWLWYFSPVPVLGLFMYVTARILKSKHRRREAAGYIFHGDGEENPDYRDMKWTDATLKQFPLIAILAGVAAGLLGIGGGMVIGPLFIQLDMQPKVGSSSCAFMILWTAVSGVVQYAFAGKLGWQFILYGVSVGFISGQLGQRLVDRMLQKYNRPSLVIFLLGGIVLVACLAMTCTGIYKLIAGIAAGDAILTFDTYDLECHNRL